ncbi:MAG: hypothetical protein RR785_09345, partial [Clostridium sp.]
IIARAIKYMTVLGVLVAFVFAFIALSRSMFDLEPDNKRPIGVVLNSCFKSAIAFLIVPAMCIAGFQLSDAMVTSVYRATAPSGGTNSVADELFLACTMDAGNNLSPKAWENAETVKRQADLSKIDYVTAYICSIFMIWNLAGICFVFIQRMFEMLLLYLACGHYDYRRGRTVPEVEEYVYRKSDNRNRNFSLIEPVSDFGSDDQQRNY